MIKTPNHFENITGITIKEINSVLDEADQYYYSYFKAKKDGKKKRLINPSQGRLEEIQDSIQKNILSKIPLIANIRGGVRKSSNVANASMHLGNYYRFQTDIEKCFPSISGKMVFNSLRAKGFSKPIADLITRTVTYNTLDSIRETALPQGIHTSTAVANLVMEKVVKRVLDLINGKNITLTVWVDDWTFSSNTDFHDLIPDIIGTIGKSGFKVAHNKTTYRHGKSVITGVVVRMNTMKETDEFRQKGTLDLNENQIKGRANYRRQIYKPTKSRKKN